MLSKEKTARKNDPIIFSPRVSKAAQKISSSARNYMEVYTTTDAKPQPIGYGTRIKKRPRV